MSTKLERLLLMDGIIRSGNYPSVQTFIKRFEVSQRTVLNDIEFLKERLHAPLNYSRSRRGYFYTDEDWKLPTLPVTEGQLLALFLRFEREYREHMAQEEFIEASQLFVSISQKKYQQLMRHGKIRPEEVQQEYGSPVMGINEESEGISRRERYLLLKEKATHVHLEHDETSWADVQSYSARQKRSTPIGGIVGRASFVGDMSEFRQLLTWGEVLHVGKNIVKGGGAYRIEI